MGEGLILPERFAIIGGAGFIGSHLTFELLNMGNSVTVVDNFSSGSIDSIEKFRNNPIFKVHSFNVSDTEMLSYHLNKIDTVIHLASNPDIAKAAIEPRIDFNNGTVLTESIAEASRRAQVKTILYASGSGVYGDAGETLLTENSALNPISTYGASKLAGEALFSSYSYMFGIKTISFRFANVVGGGQTHGVGFDFLNKLRRNPSFLEILGDGTQSKSYVHISDLISGVLTAYRKCVSLNSIFNVSTKDTLSVTEIANLATEITGSKGTELRYSGGDRGWKGDVPVVRLSSAKLNSLGWKAKFSSKEAMQKALKSMYEKNML